MSTCGSVKDVSFQTALMSGGYTTHGGAYIPQAIPKATLSPEKLKDLSNGTFVFIAKYIARLYISRDEIPTNDLDELVEAALSPERFHPDYIPIVDMGTDASFQDKKGRKCHLYRAEAYHSPSLVFKDYSMQVVGHYMNYFTQKNKSRIMDENVKQDGSVGDAPGHDAETSIKCNVLICTTGDTGSSAIQALRGLDHVNVLVGFPGGGQITDFQRLQMTTCPDENISCFQVEGTCDDIDLVRKVSIDVC